MVRHECAEALGALGAIGMKSGDAESALHRHLTNSIPEIAETCQLALARIRWTENNADEEGNAVATENCAPSNSTYDSIGNNLNFNIPKSEKRNETQIMENLGLLPLHCVIREIGIGQKFSRMSYD